MGQSQSSDNTTAASAPARQDYYELLGVERTACEEEIKKAYRRKALELHPDRNYGREEEATRLFADIQTAHEVLSDPQERAWYDSHRDVLLRGDQGDEGERDVYSYNIRLTSAEEVLKLMLKFNGRLQYSDKPNEFFGGLNQFFKQLAKEEDIVCQWDGLDQMEYPEFGHKDDDYEDVVRPFYGAWTGFATRKSYSWKDEYRLSDAPDRRIRRLMEKENKKIRDEAIQEFNDAVRSLVAFVRKRDPRVQKNQKSEAERQKALRDAAATQAARSRAAREAKLQGVDVHAVPEWAQSRTRDAHEGGFSSESEEEQHEYDCVVCDKTFRSEAQLHAHEKSKKHLKLLNQLKREMRAEGKEFDLEPQKQSVGDENEVDDDGDIEAQDVEHSTPSKANGIKVESDDEASADQPPGEEEHPATTTIPEPPPSKSASSSGEEDDIYAPRPTVESRLTSSLASTTLSSTATPTTSDPESTITPKLGKAKLKKAKRAAQKTAGESAAEAKCAVCGDVFGSKTKLFNHIKDEGHAAPVTQVRGSAGGGKGGKRKK